MAHAVSTIHVHPVIDDGIDQGVSRLAMLAFLRVQDGPWDHAYRTTLDASVTYRSHYVSRSANMMDDEVTISLLHRDHDDTTRHAVWIIKREEWEVVATLHDIDRVIDAVRAEYPDDYRPSEDVQADEDAIARVMSFVAEARHRGWSDDAVVFQFGAFAGKDAALILADVLRVASAVR